MSQGGTDSSQTIPSDLANRSLSPIQASPQSARHHRTDSEPYYEDVDPRFATEQQPPIAAAPRSPVPHALTPGPRMGGQQQQPDPYRGDYPQQHLHPNSGSGNFHPADSGSSLDRDSSYENIAEGARSPAGSDASQFTSVSQRGVNPNWRPPPGGPGGMGGGYGSGPNPQRRRDDMILGANPDFALPGSGGRGGRGGYGPRGGRGGMMGPPAKDGI